VFTVDEEIGDEFAETVEFFVDGLVTQDCLHVVASFGKGDGFDEFCWIKARARSAPIDDAVLAGIIGSKRICHFPSGGVQDLAEVSGAELEVDVRFEGRRVLNPLSLTWRASCLPTGGRSCMSPCALAWETAPGIEFHFPDG